MAFTNDGDILRVTAKMSFNSGAAQVQNVYHTQCIFTTAQTDAATHVGVEQALNDAYTNLIARLPDTLDFDTIETWNLTQDRPMIEDTWPSLVAGTNGGQMCPPQTAPLVLFTTAVARSQGRKYLPPSNEGNVLGGGLIDSLLEASMVDYAADMLIGWTISSGNYGVWGNWNVALARFAVWKAAIIKDRLRTQRRRVPGVGT